MWVTYGWKRCGLVAVRMVKESGCARVSRLLLGSTLDIHSLSIACGSLTASSVLLATPSAYCC
jgi:hypothetical protein